LLAVLALIAIYIGVHPAPLLELIKVPVQLLIPGMGGAP
jgi:NADH-quinone oxidoreductase subunit M